MKGFAFGQYYPADSVLHRMDPRAKVICAVAYIVASFLCKNTFSFLLLVLSGLALILISRIPMKIILRSVRALIFILTPLTFIFNGLKIFLKMAFGRKDEPEFSEDELLTIVEEAEAGGAIGEEQSELIANAIEFNDIDAIDILTPRVDIVAIERGTPVADIKKVFKGKPNKH